MNSKEWQKYFEFPILFFVANEDIQKNAEYTQSNLCANYRRCD